MKGFGLTAAFLSLALAPIRHDPAGDGAGLGPLGGASLLGLWLLRPDRRALRVVLQFDDGAVLLLVAGDGSLANSLPADRSAAGPGTRVVLREERRTHRQTII